MKTKRYLIIGTSHATEEDVILFTWTRAAETGIAKAKMKNKEYGDKYHSFRAIQIAD